MILGDKQACRHRDRPDVQVEKGESNYHYNYRALTRSPEPERGESPVGDQATYFAWRLSLDVSARGAVQSLLSWPDSLSMLAWSRIVSRVATSYCCKYTNGQ